VRGRGAGYLVIQLFANGTTKTISIYDSDAPIDLEHAVLLARP